MLSPSYFEHVDTLCFLDSITSKSQKSLFKGARIRKPSSSPVLPNIKYIKEIPIFMHKYIKQIVNVEGDNSYGYSDVYDFICIREENHTLIRKNVHLKGFINVNPYISVHQIKISKPFIL